MDQQLHSYGYFAKDVANKLEVTTSTLRRWSLALEEKGYKIERNEKDQRIYYERDFLAFMELKKLLNTSTSYPDAIQTIATMNIPDINPEKTPSVLEQKQSDLEGYIQETIKKAIEIERIQIVEETRKAFELEKEQIFKAIDDRFNSIVELRDRELTTQLQYLLENKQSEVAAAVEQKTPWWKRVLGIK